MGVATNKMQAFIDAMQNAKNIEDSTKQKEAILNAYKAAGIEAGMGVNDINFKASAATPAADAEGADETHEYAKNKHINLETIKGLSSNASLYNIQLNMGIARAPVSEIKGITDREATALSESIITINGKFTDDTKDNIKKVVDLNQVGVEIKGNDAAIEVLASKESSELNKSELEKVFKLEQAKLSTDNEIEATAEAIAKVLGKEDVHEFVTSIKNIIKPAAT